MLHLLFKLFYLFFMHLFHTLKCFLFVFLTLVMCSLLLSFFLEHFCYIEQLTFESICSFRTEWISFHRPVMITCYWYCVCWVIHMFICWRIVYHIIWWVLPCLLFLIHRSWSICLFPWIFIITSQHLLKLNILLYSFFYQVLFLNRWNIWQIKAFFEYLFVFQILIKKVFFITSKTCISIFKESLRSLCLYLSFWLESVLIFLLKVFIFRVNYVFGIIHI